MTNESDMINELNSVLVPDEELARIREFSSLLQETRKRREEERKSVLNVIERKYHGMWTC